MLCAGSCLAINADSSAGGRAWSRGSSGPSTAKRAAVGCWGSPPHRGRSLEAPLVTGFVRKGAGLNTSPETLNHGDGS